MRIARNKIICLNNDHKALMAKIEKGLSNIHKQIGETADPNAVPMDVTLPEVLPPVFARVDDVSSGSPAAEAGLKTGDLLAEFGTLKASNFSNMQGMSNLIPSLDKYSIRIAPFHGYFQDWPVSFETVKTKICVWW